MLSNSLILYCCLFLASVFPSIRVFSSESALPIRWPKYWSFSFSISPPSEYSGLIIFRIDYFDLLAVQGTLLSLLQHFSSKASFLHCSALLSDPAVTLYMTTGKIIPLTIWTSVGKVHVWQRKYKLVCVYWRRRTWFREGAYQINWARTKVGVVREHGG